MNQKQLVFTDLDGTLLDHYTYQTKDAEKTIAALKLNDIYLTHFNLQGKTFGSYR